MHGRRRFVCAVPHDSRVRPGDHRLDRRHRHLRGRPAAARRDGHGARRRDRAAALAVADGRGSYRLPALPPAAYQLTASLDGFQSYRRDLRVELGRTLSHDIGMVMGAFSDTIEVTGEPPLMDTTSTVSGINVTADELHRRLPIEREATEVAFLAPSTAAGDSAFETGFTPGQRPVSIAGATVSENAYQVNGLNITNFRTMIGSTMVPYEFLQEVQVKTGGYEAEFGRSTGGVVNMVTKSGTNTLHGGASAYWEPQDLQGSSPDTYEDANSVGEPRSHGDQRVVGRRDRTRPPVPVRLRLLRRQLLHKLLSGSSPRSEPLPALLGRQDRLECHLPPPDRGHLPRRQRERGGRRQRVRLRQPRGGRRAGDLLGGPRWSELDCQVHRPVQREPARSRPVRCQRLRPNQPIRPGQLPGRLRRPRDLSSLRCDRVLGQPDAGSCARRAARLPARSGLVPRQPRPARWRRQRAQHVGKQLRAFWWCTVPLHRQS